MITVLEPGVYIVAVSGGVDSVVLLRLLQQQRGLQLIVAHVNHGIRTNAEKDHQLVGAYAQQYNLVFEYFEAKLGPDASEATARKSRYDFLYALREKHHALAIVTAHHQDDQIETAMLNVLRGPSRKGFVLSERAELRRPLLGTAKTEITAYARNNNLQWNEDTTNKDPRYLRNAVRLQIMPKLTTEIRDEFLASIAAMHARNIEIDELLADQSTALDRKRFILLPHSVAREVMAAWLRQNNYTELSNSMINQLVIAAKVSAPNTRHNVYNDAKMVVSVKYLALKALER